MSRPDAGFTVHLVAWHDAHESLAAVRRAVFIEEQHVPEALEWDADDAPSLHALAVSDGRVSRSGPRGCCRTVTSDAWQCCARGAVAASVARC